MRIPINVRISALSLACMAVISFAVLRFGPEAQPTSALPSGAFIEERVEVNQVQARISVPVVIGLGAEADEQANRAISEAIGLDDLLAFVAEKSVENHADWDARLHFKAVSVGSVFRITAVSTTYANGKMPNETRSEVYIDARTGTRYQLTDLFLEKEREKAVSAIAGEIGRQMQETPGRFLPDAMPYPLPDDFFFDNGLLTIYYQPGTIAPFSEGFVRFVISLPVYETYLNKNGAFYQALTKVA